MSKKIKVALAQQISVMGDLDRNLAKAERMIREAYDNGADLVCLPEAFNTGYYWKQIKQMAEMAEPMTGRTISLMRGLAKELGIHLVVPFIQALEEGGAANSVVLIDDTGEIIGCHSKTHPVGDEAVYFRRGTKYEVFPSKLGNIGLLISYDVGFHEPARMLALKGAELICVEIACRHTDYWRRWTLTCLAARAQDNVCYVTGTCMAGTDLPESPFTGSSAVFDPTGEMLALASEYDETILYQEIDLSSVAREREFNTVLTDRHPEDYLPLTQ